MENDINPQINSHCEPSIGLSVSCTNLDVRQTLQPCCENVCNSKAQDVAAGSTVIDIGPGSSRNCTDESKQKECIITTPLPWITKNADSVSVHSCESVVCRICHNSEHPEKLVSPCFCKGSMTYVHLYCLERWISTSRCTTCELCRFEYNTKQTLRYSIFNSLRIWYSRPMSRRALQEDCQMFSLLTLVAFGIIGTLMVAVQYYILQGHLTGIARLWTKGWLIFFLFTTLVVYFLNVYMIAKTQLAPWYRWWQSARDIRLILENHKPFYCNRPQNQIPKQVMFHSPPPQIQPQPQLLPNQNQIVVMAAHETLPDTASIVLESKSLNVVQSMQTTAPDTSSIVLGSNSLNALQSMPLECGCNTANDVTDLSATTRGPVELNTDVKTCSMNLPMTSLPCSPEVHDVHIPASVCLPNTNDDGCEQVVEVEHHNDPGVSNTFT